jgi:hypothetical protein
MSLYVGGRRGSFTFTSTNEPADTTSDAFAFRDQTEVAVSAALQSNIVTITGITGVATVRITGSGDKLCAYAMWPPINLRCL